jgi:hypothetical protein
LNRKHDKTDSVINKINIRKESLKRKETMKSLRFLDRRAGYSLGALSLLLGLVVPSVLPAFASAAQVTTRSVAMSSSAATATGVEYTVAFTPGTSVASNAYVVLFFCKDSPIVGQACGAPTGFTVLTSTLGSGTNTTGAAITGTRAANKLEINDSTTNLAASTGVTFVIQGVTNPTNPTDGSGSNGLYTRIETFSSAADANAAYADPTVTTNIVDQGGVAMSVTSAIGVTATVKETMTFCVAGTVGTGLATTGNGPTGNCGADGAGSATGTDAAHVGLTLGHGTPAALDSSATDTAADWAQISTNASQGAVVSLKNTNTGNCNGLFRATALSCEIAGVGSSSTAISAGQAKFGLNLSKISTDAPLSSATPTGTLAAVAAYGTGVNYGMGANVATTYGDPIFNTSSAPIANKNVLLTFAASAAPTTPAGVYQATMNLIATGTY